MTANSDTASNRRVVKATMALAERMGSTTNRQWKHRRNLIICLASRAGLSQQMLADVFDVVPSRITAILKQYREKYGV